MAEQVATVEDRISGLLLEEEGGEPETPEVRQEPQDESRPEETEGTQEAESEEAPEVQAEPEVEEVDITTFAELAEHEGIPLENLYSLTIPVTAADGTAKQVTLGEWKDSYQGKDLLQAERGRLEQQRQVFEQETKQKAQQMDNAFFVAAKVLEDAEAAISNEDSARLQELRLTDPAEYAAIKADHKERITQVEARKQQLAQEYQQIAQQKTAQQEQQRAEYLQQAFHALPQFIPEWSDEKVAQSEKSELMKYGLGEGYAEQDLTTLADPRIVRTLRKAMLFDRQQKAAPEVKKRVVSIGKKVIGSGKSKSKTERKADQFQQDYKRFQKGGGTQADAAALIEKHLLGDF